MRLSHVLMIVGSALALASAAAPSVGQELPAMPLGDPERAFDLMTGQPDELYDARAGEEIEFDAMIAELAKADVVILAEHHASPPVQEMQQRIFAALAEQGPVALGMEFFDVEDDAALASYVSGRTQAGAMLAQTGWYKSGGYSFSYYEPLLKAAREKGAPIFGLNIPRDWTRTISESGYDGLRPEQRERIGQPAEPSSRHDYMVSHMMGTLGDLHDSSLAVQRAWDGTMAESIRRARAKEPSRTIVVVAGIGHAAHGLGIPARLKEIAPDLKVRTVAPVVAEEPDPDAHSHPGYEPEAKAVFSRGYADYVYTLSDDGGRQKYVLLGIDLEVTPTGQVGITRVRPGSVADRGGLREGDDLLMVSEMAARSVDEVRRHLGSLEFNELLHLVIRRNERSIPLSIILVPPTDGPADWLTSEVYSAVLDDFDPASPQQYLVPREPEPAGTHARLVYFRDEPERIDVFERGRLIESWILDEHGRPVLGLYADPIEDGTMRVEYDRDEEGSVTATRRFDERGQQIRTP